MESHHFFLATTCYFQLVKLTTIDLDGVQVSNIASSTEQV